MLGAELGADVPVFVHGHGAWAEGTGERLQPLTLDSAWYVLVMPACHVSTASVFQDPALTRNSVPLKIADCLKIGPENASGLAPGSLMQRTRNDCEALVRSRYAAVDEALTWLAGCGEARMTGTGAAAYALVETQALAEQCVAEAPAGWRVQVVQGLGLSPLLARLRSFAAG